MKKFVLSLLFISAFSLLSWAQITVKPGGGFHHLNLNRSTNNWDRYGGLGYQFGSTLTIGKRFYIEPGVFWMTNYSEFSKIDGNNGSGPIRFNHKISILRIPVFAGYSFWDTQGQSVDFRVLLGPAINIITLVDNSAPHTGAPEKSDYQAVYWGGNLCLDVTYWWLFLDVGYELGFSKIYKNTEKFGQAKPNTFFVNFGLRIRL
jgi:hypothetical protein